MQSKRAKTHKQTLSSNSTTLEFHKYFHHVYGKRWEQLYAALTQPTSHVALHNSFSAEDGLEVIRSIRNLTIVEPKQVKSSSNYPPPPSQPFNNLKQYYWMDMASILPPLLLDVCETDLVLDMCAAPGGKSFVLGQILFNKQYQVLQGSFTLHAGLLGGHESQYKQKSINQPQLTQVEHNKNTIEQEQQGCQQMALQETAQLDKVSMWLQEECISDYNQLVQNAQSLQDNETNVYNNVHENGNVNVGSNEAIGNNVCNDTATKNRNHSDEDFETNQVIDQSSKATTDDKFIVVNNKKYVGEEDANGIIIRAQELRQKGDKKQGRLVCNEVDTQRFYRLKKVLSEYIPQNILRRIKVTNQDAIQFWKQFEWQTYDKVLLDVPCSSDRHIIQQSISSGLKGSINQQEWSLRKCSQFADTQLGLLCSALRCLKQGGYLVYSTCSIAPVENDGVIDRAVKLFGNNISVCKNESLMDEIGIRHTKTKHGCLVLPDNTGFGPIFICKLFKIRQD